MTCSYSARILVNMAQPPQPFQQPSQPSLTFIMKNTINTHQQEEVAKPTLPFSKPIRNIPLPYKYNGNSLSLTPITYMPKFGVVFPTTRSTITSLQQELELGSVTKIDEEIYDETSVYGSSFLGKAKGVYVAIRSFDDGDDQMMAMTVSLSIEKGDNSKSEEDSLRLFGVYKKDVLESHVAVIGGTGKFKDANGYAVIRVQRSNHYIEGSSVEQKTMLLYNVYLS